MRPKVITKKEIISIAENIIKDEGIKKCSMRRLSKELDVAIGTIYNYYKSRDELLLEVFEISWKRTLKAIEDYVDSQATPIEQIKEIVSILRRDVGNRNGLGKEIIIYRISEKGNKDHLDLAGSIAEKIQSILVKEIKDHEKCEIVSRWIILIIIDKLGKGMPWSDLEWRLIEDMLGNK